MAKKNLTDITPGAEISQGSGALGRGFRHSMSHHDFGCGRTRLFVALSSESWWSFLMLGKSEVWVMTRHPLC